jgi:hypothetical protein
MQLQRVAFRDQQAWADLQRGKRETDPAGALGRPEQAGGNHVDVAGFKLVDQRAELHTAPVDAGDAEPRGHPGGDFGRLAGDLAVGRQKRVGRLHGISDADRSLPLQPGQRGVQTQNQPNARENGGAAKRRSNDQRNLTRAVCPIAHHAAPFA